jgi:hypothetical protein
LLVERGEHRDRAQGARLGIERVARVHLAVHEVHDVAMQLRIELLQVIAGAFDVLGP